MGDIHFAHALYFYALLVALPLASAFWYFGYRARLTARRHYGEGRLIDRFTARISFTRELIQLSAWILILTLLTVAMADPLKPDAPTQARAGSLQVVTVMDVSWSMGAEDYRDYLKARDGTPGTAVPGPFGSRLDMTKKLIVEQIMPAVQGNQIGIVTYMGSGFPQADLTDDYNALRFVFENWVNVGSAPGGGSNVPEGLAEALNTFKRDEDPNKQKVIVLFTDGGFNGEPAELAKVCQQIREQNIRMIVIGVGLNQPVAIPIYDNDKKLLGYRTKTSQNIVPSPASPEAVKTAYEGGPGTVLDSIVQMTGAEYKHLDESQKLDIQWATSLAGTRVEPHEQHLYQYPLVAAIALLVLMSCLALRRKDGSVKPK